METWTINEEAERLAERFAGKNRAKFARDFGVPGGQVMIYQHITGRRPISLEAAEAYAKGFGCPLEEISPRLAQEAKKAFAMLGADVASEPPQEASRPHETSLTRDEIDLIAMYRGLGNETKRFILVQLKTFSDQTLENVNSAPAEIGGTITTRPHVGHERHQTAQTAGVTGSGSAPFGGGRGTVAESMGNAQKSMGNATTGKTTKGKVPSSRGH